MIINILKLNFLAVKIIIIMIFIIIDNDFFKFLPIILSLILSIAFLTLLERKILAAMQRRRGPNVIGIYGFLQAFADGIKLILKETFVNTSRAHEALGISRSTLWKYIKNETIIFSCIKTPKNKLLLVSVCNSDTLISINININKNKIETAPIYTNK